MASPAPTQRADLWKVFGLPELAHLIYDVVHRRDRANLMQVCRRLFHSILPFVWEEVDSPDVLASMIPGVVIYFHTPEFKVMKLPGSLDLSRLSIYAPHVKRLTFRRVRIRAYEDWDRFLACTRSVDLLPNLDAIYFPCPGTAGYGSGRVDTDSVNWAIAFLSTSLQTVAQMPSKIPYAIQYTRPSWVELNSFNRLMTSIAQKCPRVCSLGVLPVRVEFIPNGRVPDENLFACNSPEIYPRFLKLGNLTSLLISAVLLSPEGLPLHFSLSRLESLSIVDQGISRQQYRGRLHIPIQAFPALKHLELNALTWSTISSLCDAKPLLAGLQSVTMIHPHNPDRNLGEDSLEEFSNVIPVVATHSRVTTLALYDYGSLQLSPKTLNAWRSLLLVNLQLGWAYTYDRTFDALCSILSCLPFLESLLLDRTQDDFELKQMRKIVELLPRLRHIQIPVKWESITQLTRADFTPCQSQSTSLLCVSSSFYQYTVTSQEVARQIARYLSVLRLKAPVVCQYIWDIYSYYPCDDDYIDEGPLKLINAELSRLWLGQYGLGACGNQLGTRNKVPEQAT
ncbi:hypothetical protein ACGC1H_006376 [Rhizoctonia solani]